MKSIRFEYLESVWRADRQMINSDKEIRHETQYKLTVRSSDRYKIR